MNTQNPKLGLVTIRRFGAHGVAPVIGDGQDGDQLDALGVGPEGDQVTNNILIRGVQKSDFFGGEISHLGEWEGQLVHGGRDPRPHQFGSGFEEEASDFVGVQVEGDVEGGGGRGHFS